MFKNYGLASGGDGISVPGFVLYSVIALAFYGACQIYAQKKEAIEAPNKMGSLSTGVGEENIN